MTTKEFKKIARILKDVYKELDIRATANNISLLSPEYDELKSATRIKVLESQGYTLEEYRETGKKIKEESNEMSLTSLLKKTPKILSEDDVKNIAHSVAQEYIKPPIVTNNIKNEIVKEITREVTIEKPKILETVRIQREDYDDRNLKKEIKNLDKKINDIKIPQPKEIDEDKITNDIFDALKKDINKEIEMLGMPDFRKLAMGLQNQIDETKIGINNFELEFARKTTGNSYMEYTEVAGNITQVNYWSDSGKGTKLFTKDITYSGANPTLVVVTDEVSGKVLTTTIAYSGEDITSVTKVIS